MNQYVALYYRNGRYVVTLAAVLSARTGFPDAFTVTSDVATTVAKSTRHTMGTAMGLWAFSSWAFYSMLFYKGFTVVTKNMLPSPTSNAEVLAAAWGLSSTIPWH